MNKPEEFQLPTGGAALIDVFAVTALVSDRSGGTAIYVPGGHVVVADSYLNVKSRLGI